MEEPPTTDRAVSLDEAIAIAIRLQQSDQWVAAGDMYRRILEIAPDYPDAVHYSGVLAHQEGRSEQAVTLIERSLELEPDRADWYSNLGIVLRDRLRLDAASVACQHAIALDPDHANAHNNLGVILRAQGKLVDAEAAYRAAIRVNPEHSDAYTNLGILLNGQKRTHEAVACFCKVITLRPKHPEARRLLALAHCTLGEVDEAVGVFEEWLKEEPDHPIARHMIAACSGRDVPSRASDAFIEQTFDSFAGSFDAKLAKLLYRAPALVAEMLGDPDVEGSKSLDVLDAGCGTGLCGPLIAPYARRLVGVDLSARMLAQAQARGVYDELVKRELTDYLRDSPQAFDVIVSADTLVYFGPLDGVVRASADALRSGGRLIFTVEESIDARSDAGYSISPNGRYSHTHLYLERVLADAKLRPEIVPAELRLEAGDPVPGLVVRATKPPASSRAVSAEPFNEFGAAGKTMNLPRRQFFMLVAGAFLQLDNHRPKRNMLVRSVRPEDLEMPPSGFSDYITPIEHFFVRTHVYEPRVNLNEWQLTVDGEVATALKMTMEDLKRLPAVELVGVVECAGNGRGFYEPSMPGLQWATGGVGNGRWRGVRLADVLRRAGVKESASEILFNGADGPIGAMPDFQRSIPIRKALDPRTLLAYEMNGEALPAKHGFPLRVVAPGWAGNSWIKWLTSISVLDKEHDGFWMKRAYRHPGRPVERGTPIPPEQMQPVTSLRVKSVIAWPLDGSQAIKGTPVTIRGVAWSGDAGPVTAVDISVDGGRSWRPATLARDQRTQFGWRQWEYGWTPSREAYYTILARARDAAGNTQPFDQEWNPSGYGWNVIPRAGVNVVTALSDAAPQVRPSNVKAEQPTELTTACLGCHDADVIRQQRLTRAQWDVEINKMTGWGARVKDEDRNRLLDYLFSNFGPRQP